MKDIIEQNFQEVDNLYHCLITKYQQNKKIIYIVVEGVDDVQYYTQFIEQYLPEDWDCLFIEAAKSSKKNCKESIIKFYTDLDWKRFNNKQIIILMDQDLTKVMQKDFTAPDNVYITDKYSIENNLISSKIFCNVLTMLCNFHNFDIDNKKKLTDLFDKILAQYYNAMIDIMSYIIY